MPAPKCTECGEVHLASTNGAIYCCGPILRAVQMSNVYSDSKTFVDMSSRYSPERILADWQLFSSCKRNEASVRHLTNFVENHFDPPGSEMDTWCPPDWRSEPKYITCIKDERLKKFAIKLNAMWKQLGRYIKDCVRTNPLQYSMVYMPNPVIVPGGRFSEMYFWDTYWIVRGLLYSGMIQTARGMIDNLLYLVQEYKFVPNGGRIYYWGRSQPPLLVNMVKAYVEVTNDKRYAVQVLPLLETEMDNFLKSHEVKVNGRTMYQYRDKSAGPRPEAYREDMDSASGFSCEEEKEEHFSNIKAACESGMAFSSRWYVSPCGNNVGTLANIKTTWIVPVELNCILFRNCKTLAEFNVMAGKEDRAEYYRGQAASLIKAITAVLYQKERGIWLDYDLKNKQPRDYFVVTNLSPLWARAYPINDSESISELIMQYIEENKLDSYPGGVPHTLSNTGQQWDYPNVWPPMMNMLIDGLTNLGTPAALEMAGRWRERWVRATYVGYEKNGFLFDKYTCEEAGGPGSGGEYQTQTDYGWTIGVVSEMLAKNGDTLTASDEPDANDECCCECDQSPEDMEEVPITSEAQLPACPDDAANNPELCDCVCDAANEEEALNECINDVASFATSEACITPEKQQQQQDPCAPPTAAGQPRLSATAAGQPRLSATAADKRVSGTGTPQQRASQSNPLAKAPCPATAYQQQQQQQQQQYSSPQQRASYPQTQAQAQRPCPKPSQQQQQQQSVPCPANSATKQRNSLTQQQQQQQRPISPCPHSAQGGGQFGGGQFGGGNQKPKSCATHGVPAGGQSQDVNRCTPPQDFYNPCPQPIEIEETDFNCVEISPSEEQQILGMCQCESTTNSCNTMESYTNVNDNAQAPKKMFPLADAKDACKKPEPVEEEEPECACPKIPKQKGRKECS